MSNLTALAAVAVNILFAYLCLLPALCLGGGVLSWLYATPLPALAARFLLALRSPLAEPGMTALPLVAMLVWGLVVRRTATWLTTAATVAYKRHVMGPLEPGRDLLEDATVLWRYALFRRMLQNSFFDYASSVRIQNRIALGA